uniref:SHSP domain-containing protein n=1 Tax=Panagrolaimus sp. JU765 TaxID=591449 RepID=A0AC34Q5N0_9BILA
MATKYYEESEYYVKEYERTNGLEREMVDQEFRSHGKPLGSRMSTSIRDLPPLSRYYDDWDDRRREIRSYFDRDRDRRQLSLPPRRSHYLYTSDEIAPSPPRTNTTHDSYRHDYSTRRNEYSTFGSAAVPQSSLLTQPHDVYRRSPEVPRSSFPVTTTTPATTPGTVQAIAGAGDIINTENGFTIQLDVKHFEPHEIKISLTGNTLSVVGEKTEQDPISNQQLIRSFSRRYAIPDDIRLESIKSHLTDTGILIIRGNRKSWKQTDIDIHVDYAPVSDV